MFKKRPYPMRSHYLMVDKRASTDDQVVIRSIVDEDERTSLPKEAATALFRLDGYTPEKKAFRGFTEEERASWLEYFEEEDLLQWRKPIESLGAGNVLWAWYVSTTPLSKTIRPVAQVICALLEWIAIPIYIASMLWVLFHSDMYSRFVELDTVPFYASLVLWLFIALFLHELGHAIAAASYGGKTVEAGLMLKYFLFGAYVITDDYNYRNRPCNWSQEYAAGCEMNALLAAILLLLSYRLTGELAEFFKMGFLVNWYSMVNLFPLPNNLGLDGTRAIHHLSKELPYVKNLFWVVFLVFLPGAFQLLTTKWDGYGADHLLDFLVTVLGSLCIAIPIAMYISLFAARVHEMKKPKGLHGVN